MFLFAALSAAGCSEPTAVNTSTPEQANQLFKTQDETVSLDAVQPPSQLRVIEIVNEYAAKYEAATNQLQKSTVWKERSKAMKAAASSAKGEKGRPWVGILESMGTTTEGNAYIIVRIAPNIKLLTMNMELFDIGEETLIKHGSKDYLALSAIPEGSVISFDFAINPEGAGMTEKEKMIDPSFPTRFSKISQVDAEELRKLAKVGH